MHFVSKVDDYDLKSKTMGKYLLEVGILEWRLLAMPPSLVAAAAIWLSRLILGNDKWVRDACSLTLIMLITLSDSSPPILPHDSSYAGIFYITPDSSDKISVAMTTIGRELDRKDVQCDEIVRVLPYVAALSYNWLETLHYCNARRASR
jgi:hypothetical protein